MNIQPSQETPAQYALLGNKGLTRTQSIALLVTGYVTEFFSFLAMSALYFIPLKAFDPKEKEIVKDPSGKAEQKPILLVHGLFHNSSGWFYHKHKLNKAGFKNVFTVNLGAIPNKSIPEYAEVLKKRVNEIRSITGRDDIDFVGHSMGGLVSSYFALNMAEESGTQVDKIVTLNSPILGTKMHIFAPGPCVRNMSNRSDFVKNLSQKIKSSPKTRFFHFSSKADLLVRPYFSTLNIKDKSEIKSLSPKSTHICPNLGHTGILFSGTASRIIVDQLRNTQA